MNFQPKNSQVLAQPETPLTSGTNRTYNRMYKILATIYTDLLDTIVDPSSYPLLLLLSGFPRTSFSLRGVDEAGDTEE